MTRKEKRAYAQGQADARRRADYCEAIETISPECRAAWSDGYRAFLILESALHSRIGPNPMEWEALAEGCPWRSQRQGQAWCDKSQFVCLHDHCIFRSFLDGLKKSADSD